MGVTILGMTVKEFWKSTPNYIGALFDIHCKFNGWGEDKEEVKKEKKVCFIDELPFL